MNDIGVDFGAGRLFLPQVLLSAETMMSQKELEHQQAIFEYNSALEYYKFLKN